MEELISANFMISLKVFHIVLESICGVKRYKLLLLAFNLHLEIIDKEQKTVEEMG